MKREFTHTTFQLPLTYAYKSEHTYTDASQILSSAIWKTIFSQEWNSNGAQTSLSLQFFFLSLSLCSTDQQSASHHLSAQKNSRQDIWKIVLNDLPPDWKMRLCVKKLVCMKCFIQVVELLTERLARDMKPMRLFHTRLMSFSSSCSFSEHTAVALMPSSTRLATR